MNLINSVFNANIYLRKTKQLLIISVIATLFFVSALRIPIFLNNLINISLSNNDKYINYYYFLDQIYSSVKTDYEKEINLPQKTYNSEKSTELQNYISRLDEIRNEIVNTVRKDFEYNQFQEIYDYFPLFIHDTLSKSFYEIISCDIGSIKKILVYRSEDINPNNDNKNGKLFFFELSEKNIIKYGTSNDNYYSHKDLINIFKERKCESWYDPSPAQKNGEFNAFGIPYFENIQHNQNSLGVEVQRNVNLLKSLYSEDESANEIPVKLDFQESTSSLKEKIIKIRDETPFLSYLDKFNPNNYPGDVNQEDKLLDLVFCDGAKTDYFQVAIPQKMYYGSKTYIYSFKRKAFEWKMTYDGYIFSPYSANLYPEELLGAYFRNYSQPDPLYQSYLEYAPKLQSSDCNELKTKSNEIIKSISKQPGYNNIFEEIKEIKTDAAHYLRSVYQLKHPGFQIIDIQYYYYIDSLNEIKTLLDRFNSEGYGIYKHRIYINPVHLQELDDLISAANENSKYVEANLGKKKLDFPHLIPEEIERNRKAREEEKITDLIFKKYIDIYYSSEKIGNEAKKKAIIDRIIPGLRADLNILNEGKTLDRNEGKVEPTKTNMNYITKSIEEFQKEADSL